LRRQNAEKKFDFRTKMLSLLTGLLLPVSTFVNLQSITVPSWLFEPPEYKNQNLQTASYASAPKPTATTFSPSLSSFQISYTQQPTNLWSSSSSKSDTQSQSGIGLESQSQSQMQVQQEADMSHSLHSNSNSNSKSHSYLNLNQQEQQQKLLAFSSRKKRDRRREEGDKDRGTGFKDEERETTAPLVVRPVVVFILSFTGLFFGLMGTVAVLVRMFEKKIKCISLSISLFSSHTFSIFLCGYRSLIL
jgi:hypothetical protein